VANSDFALSNLTTHIDTLSESLHLSVNDMRILLYENISSELSVLRGDVQKIGGEQIEERVRDEERRANQYVDKEINRFSLDTPHLSTISIEHINKIVTCIIYFLVRGAIPITLCPC
jgi:hypothetical protein